MLDPVEVLVPRLMKRITVTSLDQAAAPPGPAWLQPQAHSFHASGFDEVGGRPLGASPGCRARRLPTR